MSDNIPHGISGKELIRFRCPCGKSVSIFDGEGKHFAAHDMPPCKALLTIDDLNDYLRWCRENGAETFS